MKQIKNTYFPIVWLTIFLFLLLFFLGNLNLVSSILISIIGGISFVNTYEAHVRSERRVNPFYIYIEPNWNEICEDITIFSDEDRRNFTNVFSSSEKYENLAIYLEVLSFDFLFDKKKIKFLTDINSFIQDVLPSNHNQKVEGSKDQYLKLSLGVFENGVGVLVNSSLEGEVKHLGKTWHLLGLIPHEYFHYYYYNLPSYLKQTKENTDYQILDGNLVTKYFKVKTDRLMSETIHMRD